MLSVKVLILTTLAPHPEMGKFAMYGDFEMFSRVKHYMDVMRFGEDSHG